MIARGARSSRRRFGGALEPFALLDIEYVPTRSGLARLQQARIRRAFAGILASLARMQRGGSALELVRRLLSDDEPDCGAYAVTVRALELLDTEPEGRLPQVLIGHRMRILSLHGVAPDLERCGGCGRRPAQRQAALFDPGRRQLMCRACGGARCHLSGRSRVLLSTLCGRGWDEVVTLDWPQAVMDEVQPVVDALISLQLQ